MIRKKGVPVDINTMRTPAPQPKPISVKSAIKSGGTARINNLGEYAHPKKGKRK